MKTLRPPRRPPTGRPLRQRGVVLLFSLIALVIMLIAAVALFRSFQSSLFTAGNIAFKRDMRNQSELASGAALTAFRFGGTLNTRTQRSANQGASNYSATMLATDPQGIPSALALDDATFAATYQVADIQPAGQSVKVRYVIDRMCSTVGDEATLGANSCVLATNPTPPGRSLLNLQSADAAPLCPGCTSAAPQGVVYRLSVRVTGPRNTQSFFQSTFTVPS